MKAPKGHLVRHPYERVRVRAIHVGESRTQQSHAEACDINNVIRRFDNTGSLPPGRDDGQYADVTHLQNRELGEQIVESREAFERLEQARVAAAKAKKEGDAHKQVELEEEISRLREENAALQDGKSVVKKKDGDADER